MSNGGRLNYTRAGNLYTDTDNNLVNSNGYFVQGFMVDTDGNLILDGLGNPQLENINIDPDYYDVSINSNGAIVGLEKTTNDKHVLGQLILSTFSNQNALEKGGPEPVQKHSKLGRSRV